MNSALEIENHYGVVKYAEIKELLKNKQFQENFEEFAKKNLKINNNINLDLHATITCSYLQSEKLTAYQKENIGFFFLYKDENNIFDIVYEHNGQLSDPSDGFFSEWFVMDNCGDENGASGYCLLSR